jgi:hypothetical protein
MAMSNRKDHTFFTKENLFCPPPLSSGSVTEREFLKSTLSPPTLVLVTNITKRYAEEYE